MFICVEYFTFDYFPSRIFVSILVGLEGFFFDSKITFRF